MIAALYIRVSTDEQARDQRLSLPIQEARCRAAAEADGATTIALYADPGYTSTTLDRPAIQALLGDLPGIDRIYSLDMSRVTSSVRDLEVIRDRLRATGADLITLDGVPDITTDTGELVSTITVASRRHVLQLYRARVIQSLDELARRGHHHGRCPLGYVRPRDPAAGIIRDAPLEVDAAEAEIVRRVYREFARGRSIAAIARGLNGDGVPGKRGPTQWWTGTLTRILDNPTYLGMVRYQGVLHEGGHEPIIGLDLWRQVQARREADVHVAPRLRSSLSPLLTCGICGGSIHRTCGGQRSVIYRCTDQARRPPADRHEPLTKSAVAVEMVIWAWTEELLSGDLLADALARLSSPALRGTGHLTCPPLPSPADELADVEARITYNLEAARAGAVPPDLLARENAPLLARRAELQRAAQGPAVGGLSAAQLRRLRERGGELVAWYSRLEDQGRQRAFLGRLYARIELHRGGLVFHHALAGMGPRGMQFPRWLGGARGWTAVDLTPWAP